MPSIALLTFNARYPHSAFGLRYLKANLGELANDCAIVEFDLEKRPADALEHVLKLEPRIVGLGVYVWNARQSLESAKALKALRPHITLVLGGPEISYEHEQQEISRYADHIICGEADREFAPLCRAILAGSAPPRVIDAAPPDLTHIATPYPLYDDQDIAHRTVYVESSRGCPFSCEFCLSSLDIPVRRFDLARFLPEMQYLLDRGVRQFKFVDRTFNVNTRHACAVLDFFLERMRPGLFLHFEMMPDHLADEVGERLGRFPLGTLQLEIGIQTFNEEVAQRIGRRQDNAMVERNLRFLRERTQAHLHADLVAGLPGESIESFAAGFDRLLALRPHEIQLGILKRLRGAPIGRHAEMVYSPDAPYEVLQSDSIAFEKMQDLKRIARLWDLYGNSGNFRETLPLLLAGPSNFASFAAFASYVYTQTGRTHEISLARQCELAMGFLKGARVAGEALARDYLRPGRRDLPGLLQPFMRSAGPKTRDSALPLRQRRHLA